MADNSIVLSNTSTEAEIDEYLRGIYAINEWDKDKIILLVKNMVSLGVDSYQYYLAMNRLVQNKGDTCFIFFNKWKEYFGTTDQMFTGFYFVAYYYWENKKTKPLEEIIKEAKDIFNDYALFYQMKGRIARRNKKFEEALSLDTTALELLHKKNIKNDGIQITSAATVGFALENDYLNFETEKITTSISDVCNLISTNNNYHKYYYLVGKLYLFRAYKQFCDELNSTSVDSDLKEARIYFEKSIELLNSSSDEYSRTLNKYNDYISKLDLIENEIRSFNVLELKKNSQESDILNLIQNISLKYENSIWHTLLLKKLLLNIKGLELDSGNHSYALECFNRNNVSEQLFEDLNVYLCRIINTNEMKDIAYLAYTILADHYWNNKQIEKLNIVINDYSEIFEAHALSQQILGRTKRFSHQYKESLACDKKALQILKEQNISNDRIRLTTAATVAKTLENGYLTIVDDTLLKGAIEIADTVINRKNVFHKWYYLKAKLLIFSCDYYQAKKEKITTDSIKQNTDLAKSMLDNAIAALDPASENYFSLKMKYEFYRLEADRVQSKYLLKKDVDELSIRQHDFQENIVARQHDLESTLHKEQVKYLEILAIFVSVISIIITMMGTINSNFDVVEIIAIIAAMCVSILAVYSAFLLLLNSDRNLIDMDVTEDPKEATRIDKIKENNKKRAYLLIITIGVCLILLLIIGFSCNNRLANKKAFDSKSINVNIQNQTSADNLAENNGDDQRNQTPADNPTGNNGDDQNQTSTDNQTGSNGDNQDQTPTDNPPKQ